MPIMNLSEADLQDFYYGKLSRLADELNESEKWAKFFTLYHRNEEWESVIEKLEEQIFIKENSPI